MPKPTSRPVLSQPVPTQQTPFLGWIVVLAIAAFIALLVRSNDGTNDQKQVIDQNQEQKEDKAKPDPQADKGAFKDCVLLAVYDKKAVNEDIGYLATLQDDAFWSDVAPTIVKDVEFIASTDDIGKKAIAAANIPAPFVMLLNTKSKKPLWTIPMPKGGTSEIAKRLK